MALMEWIAKAILPFLNLVIITILISFLVAIFIVPQVPVVLNPASSYWSIFNPDAIESDPASALGIVMGELFVFVPLIVLSVEMLRRAKFFLAGIFGVGFILLSVGNFLDTCTEPGISGSVLFNVLFSQLC